MSDVIHLEGVGKRYRQVEDAALLLRRLVFGRVRRKVNEVWALRDIDLDVASGETVGVIGRNGSGKTTLLRLLGGVSAPTTGHLRVVGTIAPLIGVGVGFNAELTGRENVMINGQILGMTERQILERFDAIVDFSEIEPFIDVPVKYYSSGMFLRLAFAVAVHIDPMVLLVDEVLAVGDLAFSLKCMERMKKMQEGGTTTVVVTHNLNMLHQWCERAVLLHHGEKRFDGGVEDCIGEYHKVIHEQVESWDERAALMLEENKAPVWIGGADAQATLVDDAGEDLFQVRTGDTMRLRTRVSFDVLVERPILGVHLVHTTMGNVYAVHTLPGEYEGDHGPGRPLELDWVLDNQLLPGSYRIQAVVLDPNGEAVMAASPYHLFSVTSTRRASGLTDLRARVEVDGSVIDLSQASRLRAH